MNYPSKKIILAFAGSAFMFFAGAQDKPSKAPASSYFKASASYLSNSVYSGRKDSLVTPYFTPALGYYNKSGFYVSAAASYLSSAAESRIDLFTLDIGYDFTISDQVSGGIYASKYFYNQSSSAVKSDMRAGLGGSISYDPGFVTLSGGLDIALSSSADIIFNASLAHAFTIGEEGNQWTITPTVSTSLGTQNFYQGYVKNRRGSGNQNIQLQKKGRFSLLDYELSLPIAYDAKKWGLFFTPTYALPQNPITLTLTNGTVIFTEKIENTFYAEVGVYFKF